MQARAARADFVTVVEDSRRWAVVTYRHDDIVVATPPKSGTTWTQGIVASLLWPDGNAPGTPRERNLWPDMRIRPVGDMGAALEAPTHRRCIKTHTPADCIPLDPRVRYLVVHRSAPDALVSWGNHRATMRPEVMDMLNQDAQADGLHPRPLRFHGDYTGLFEEWSSDCSPAVHLASWWPLRDEPNVLLLHYADLSRDLSGEMRRIAAFLDLDVPDRLWREAVDRCVLAAMRESARATGGMDQSFEGGPDAFFNKGGNGRGRTILTAAQIGRVERHCADLLDRDALDWLEHGSASQPS